MRCYALQYFLMSIFLLILILFISFSLTVVFGVYAVWLIKRQVKLHHSIMLIELKSTKLHYLAFMMVVAALFVLLIWAFSGASPFERGQLYEAFGFSYAQSSMVFAFLLFFLFVLEFLLAVLFFSKSAVVDKGIFTALQFLNWYHVHDYIIDESKAELVLTTNAETFLTVRGTTAPLRVKKNDIPKLKFILNKNKNKFSMNLPKADYGEVKNERK